MNKEIAMAWIERLRSGVFKQGRGALRNSDGSYDALGVLCEVVKDSPHVDQVYMDYQQLRKATVTSGTNMRFSETSVMALNDSGYIDPDTGEITEALSFDEIADIIQVIYQEL